VTDAHYPMKTSVVAKRQLPDPVEADVFSFQACAATRFRRDSDPVSCRHEGRADGTSRSESDSELRRKAGCPARHGLDGTETRRDTGIRHDMR